MPAAWPTAAKAFGSRSFGGVLIRSRARLISSATAAARSAAALCALSRGLAPSSGDLAERRWPCRPSSLPSLCRLVRGEGVRAEQRALGDGRDVARRPRRAARTRPSWRRPARGRRRPRRGAAPRRRSRRPSPGPSPRPTASTTGALRPAGGGQLGHLALGAGRAERLQDGGELAVERLVHGLGARGDDGALGALGHADDEGVRAQRRGGGGAESQSSHGGGFSLPLSWSAGSGWGRPRGEPSSVTELPQAAAPRACGRCAGASRSRPG